MNELLAAESGGAGLVLEGGSLRIVDPVPDGALVVVTRDDLKQQLPQDRPVGEGDLEFHAAELESAIDSLGG
nr:hypothetical protein [Rhodococcus sp. HNM0569]